MEKQNNLMWRYIGKNKGQVMITCSKKEWNTICKALDLVRKSKVYKCSKFDNWNYSYTGLDRRQ